MQKIRRRIRVLAALSLLLGALQAQAVFSVHDSVLYVHNTVKAIQDELYQQLDLDYQIELLGETGQILRTSNDTLKVCQETYNTAKDIYQTATDLTGYVGDPMRMTRYLNSKFWYSRDIDLMLSVTNDAIGMSNSRVVNIDDVLGLLKKANYAAIEVVESQMEELASAQKRAIAVREHMTDWTESAGTQVKELNREDQMFKGRESSLNEIEYANYKTNIHQANTLSQLLAVETTVAAMQSQQIYQQNARQDRQDLDVAQEIHDRYTLTETLSRQRKQRSSLSRQYVSNVLER